ncbi:MAG: class A beta-lactamase-related serine hydrolase [Balneolaceae bacterium]|nr:MAG: class A beta-lactamase-related serine hydrolase [Balneolaceae bacterium]
MNTGLVTATLRLRHLVLFVLAVTAGILPAFSQSFGPVIPEEAGFSSERLARLTSTLNAYAEQQRLSGGVAMVLRDGNAVFFESFGMRDVEAGDPMPKDAIFRIASQTKAIVSVAVMMLQEEGRLLIGDPVGKYLPEYSKTTVAVRDEDGGYTIADARRAVTIRDLLTHTAGIGYGYGTAADLWKEAGIQGWYFADRDEPIRETVRRIAALPHDAHPGERFVYGYATDILGVLVEEISGQPLDHFLESRIFEPLGMNDTHFYLPDTKTTRLAAVYSATDGPGIVRAADPGGSVGQGHYVNGPRKSFSGGAGLLSTANDYARFLQMMLNGGELDGYRILSPKTVELMTINHLTGISFRDGVGMGLGFDVVEHVGARGTPGAVGDYGWGGAYHSTYWVSPADRLVVVFFTQLIPATGSDIHGKLRALIYQAMTGQAGK